MQAKVAIVDAEVAAETIFSLEETKTIILSPTDRAKLDVSKSGYEGRSYIDSPTREQDDDAYSKPAHKFMH
jgi:hypothetical protein